VQKPIISMPKINNTSLLIYEKHNFSVFWLLCGVRGFEINVLGLLINPIFKDQASSTVAAA
jgi:hypothetical protein